MKLFCFGNIFVTFFLLFVTIQFHLRLVRTLALPDTELLSSDGNLTGQLQITTKIFGGDPVTDRNPIPYQLSLRLNGRHVCGAVIIEPQKVVTAAHCFVKSQNASEYLVIAGDIDLLHIEEGEQVVRIKKIVVHPQYIEKTSENDIAVLYLEKNLVFNKFVNKIGIPDAQNEDIVPEVLIGKKAMASGWGRTSKSYGLSDILQKVNLTIISNEECKKSLGEANILKGMVCAQGETEGKDTCEGDSGGPLVIQDNKNNEPLLIGVTSWGPKVCGGPLPGVYTLVSVFTTWILTQKVEDGTTTMATTMMTTTTPQPTDSKLTPIPLHRYYNTKNGDHFYTTNWDEIGSGKWAYVYEGVAGKVYPSASSGTVPLHRYYNGGNNDHFYTTNWSELGGGKGGYTYEGIAGYVYEKPVEGTIPLHRYYNGGNGDHFYTTNWAELGGGKGGYKYEGIQGYIFPS